MTVHEVIDVIAVRDRFMATIGTVDVRRVMLTSVIGSANDGVGIADFDGVLVNVVAVGVVQVTVVVSSTSCCFTKWKAAGISLASSTESRIRPR